MRLASLSRVFALKKERWMHLSFAFRFPPFHSLTFPSFATLAVQRTVACKLSNTTKKIIWKAKKAKKN
jgi:hypothetical protein